MNTHEMRVSFEGAGRLMVSKLEDDGSWHPTESRFGVAGDLVWCEPAPVSLASFGIPW
jgi:hypothetical protein